MSNTGAWDSSIPPWRTPMPAASPGRHIFASNCACPFYQKTYPYAIGPRLGVAYQINPKTVLRGGWGVTYQFVANPAGATIGTPGVYNVTPNSPSYIPLPAQFVNDQAPGAIQQPTWPVSTNIYPLSGLRGNTGLYLCSRHRTLYARRERKPAAAHQPIQRRLPAGDYPEFRYGSVLCGQPRRLGAGRAVRISEPTLRRNNTRNMACILTLEPARREPTT